MVLNNAELFYMWAGDDLEKWRRLRTIPVTHCVFGEGQFLEVEHSGKDLLIKFHFPIDPAIQSSRRFLTASFQPGYFTIGALPKDLPGLVNLEAQ